MLCSILDRLQPQSIVSYHEHDSLLEHVFDEELTEEERKAAWEKYKADMAAESVQYNYQALQNRLEEEQLEQRAQVQRMQQMIQDQTNSATASSTDVGGFLYKLSTSCCVSCEQPHQPSEEERCACAPLEQPPGASTLRILRDICKRQR